MALGLGMAAVVLASVPSIGLAAQPAAAPSPVLNPAPVATAQPTAPAATPPAPVAAKPAANPRPVMKWSLASARALLAYIDSEVAAEGLIRADYKPEALKAAIAGGEGAALDQAASTSFAWLAEDLRDGRTPMNARVQFFAFDKDMDVNPTEALMTRALTGGDVAGVLNGLDPTFPDYKVLKAELAKAPDAKTKALIQANMDRWRWFSRDLGEYYLITNVPEFQLRLVRRDKIIKTYRTIVGKPGKTATPQLSELVEGVVFNPTWTVPQSIVVGEGLARSLGGPAGAKAKGYTWTQSGKTITLVQQPGPGNSLGKMKLDMPNPHAIFLHDTPNRNLFNQTFRALSHGCVRTERATELAIAMAIIGGGKTPEEAKAISDSGKYTKVPMTRTMPVYIAYFTYAQNIDGQLTSFADIYGRDAPVLASFKAPRVAKTGQRTSTEKVIKLDNPL